jgi:tetratricopeptide (TPR) repeat protein
MNKRMRIRLYRPALVVLLWGLSAACALAAPADPVAIRLERAADKLRISLLWPSPVEAEASTDGRELLLRFARGTEIGGLDRLTAESDWIEGASGGFDTLLLRAARDVAFSVRASENELIVTLSLSASRAGENGAGDRNAQKRMDILEARLLGETGRFREALDGLHRMLAEDSEDPDVLTALANLELQAGQWRRAEILYNRALAKMPGNEDVLEARARLAREQGSQAAAGFTWKSVRGGWQERLVRASGQIKLGDTVQISFAGDQDYVVTGAVRRADGTTGSFDDLRHRAEVSIQHTLERGYQFSGSFFLDDWNKGFGLAMTVPDLHGRSRVVAEVRRPYWEFVEGLLDGGFRSRIEVYREQRLTQRWNGWISASLNSYGLGSLGKSAGSAGVSGGLNFLLAKVPNLTLQYGFDGEYRTSIRSEVGPSGVPFTPIPLVSREVHAIDLAAGCNLTRGLRVDGFAGYGVDRLGGTGPYLGLRIAGEVAKRLEVQGDFERRLDSVNTGSVVDRMTGRLLWKVGR